MSRSMGPRDERSTDAVRPTREDIEREQHQEAVWNSYEHGAPESGPAEDVEIDNLDPDVRKGQASDTP